MPNRVRYDGAADRFYEVWYTIFTDPASGDGFWIRYTLLNPRDRHPEAGAALWFAHTSRAHPEKSVAIKTVLPPGSFEAPTGRFDLRFGDSTLVEGVLRGRFAADGHEVSWDLEYPPAVDPHYFFGERLRRFAESRNSVTIPNPRIFLSGTVTVDGERHDIRSGPGHQAHHWGRQRAPRWLWAHCSAFEEDPEATVELLTGSGPGGLELTFLNFYDREGTIFCNGLTGIIHNRSACGPGFWHFEGYTATHHVVADIRTDLRHVQKFVYTSPSYRSSECWNTQVADCVVRVYEGTRADSERLVRTLHARGTTAAEVHDQRPERIVYNAL